MKFPVNGALWDPIVERHAVTASGRLSMLLVARKSLQDAHVHRSFQLVIALQNIRGYICLALTNVRLGEETLASDGNCRSRRPVYTQKPT
jgi:hypothetical protein